MLRGIHPVIAIWSAGEWVDGEKMEFMLNSSNMELQAWAEIGKKEVLN